MIKNKKKVGIVSYNIHYRYSNYGSILQSYALQESIKAYTEYDPVVIDYCPPGFEKCCPLNPLEFTGDIERKYEERRIDIKGIAENEKKIKEFVNIRYNLSKGKYFSSNFNESWIKEDLNAYVCGSDAIWSTEFFGGFDSAFYGEYSCMKNRSFAYAASFGETSFDDKSRKKMLSYMNNFNMIGIRETIEINHIKKYTNKYIKRVVDPTLLLRVNDYLRIMSRQLIKEPYLLIYTRYNDENMNNFAKKIARDRRIKVISISLLVDKETDFTYLYKAGIEEFLSLIYYAEVIVTNSLHGTIFSVLMEKEFFSFPRIHGDRKIDEFLKMVNLKYRKMTGVTGIENYSLINYKEVRAILNEYRNTSIEYLKQALSQIP